MCSVRRLHLSALPGSCRRRGCAAAVGDAAAQHPTPEGTLVDGRWMQSWAERRDRREQLSGREHRIRNAERLLDGTPLTSEASQDVRSATREISFLGRQRKWEEALAVFAAIPEPDTVCRSATVDACGKALQIEVALQLFAEMPVKNLGAYTSLINMFGRLRRVREAEDLLREMKQDCLQPDGYVYSSVIMAYGVFGDVDSALRMFRERQLAFPPSKFAFGAVMSACARNGQLEHVQELLKELEASGLDVTVEHITSIVAACTHKKDEATASEAFANMRRRGLKPDVVAYTTLMGCIAGADAVAKVEALLVEMEQEGVRADSFVFDAMLEAAISAMDTEGFNSIRAEMEKRSLPPTKATRRRIQIMSDRLEARSNQQETPSHASHPLPPGWQATWDPSNGRNYYWNEKDPASTTTWERPSM